MDTLSANHLPCYGYERNTAPNLCQFAKQNILFSHAYANGMFTLPSDVSMFTGLYPNIHRVNLSYLDSLSKKIPFLPEILQKNGYSTLFVMPLEDTNLPIDKVFNRGIDKIYLEDVGAWDQGLRDFNENVNQGKKTFLFLHTYTVHSPYLIGNKPKLYTTDIYPKIPLTEEDYNSTSKEFYQEVYKRIQNNVTDPNYSTFVPVYQDILSIIRKNNYNPKPLDTILLSQNYYRNHIQPYLMNIKYNDNIDIHNPRDVDYLRALYDQRVHDLDRNEIPIILQYLLLNERVKKSTIVIFTSEHGEEFMEHGSIYHQTIYDSNLHVPLVFYVPGNTKPKLISTPVQLTDLAPTILEILGIHTENEFQGVSLVGEIKGEGLPERLLISDGRELNTLAIRNKAWKLHVKRNDDGSLTPYELYSIQKDPDERENVLFSHLNVAEGLVSQYQDYERSWRTKTDRLR